MKYDPEYNSYRLCESDLTSILEALTFYSTYSPLDKSKKEYIKNLIREFDNSCATQDQ